MAQQALTNAATRGDMRGASSGHWTAKPDDRHSPGLTW